MSKLGQHGVARWGITILTGWLVVFGAQAQQTPSSTDTDNQGGFVVIEETQAPPPPRPLPISIPAQTVPLSGSTVPVPVASGASPSPYKPGSAVYEIPLVKPGASGAVVAETSATPLPKQSVNPGAAKVVREPVAVALLPTSVVSVPTVKALPPPPPKTWTLRQGYPIGQERQPFQVTLRLLRNR